jgi:F-type H+-transporting ATPase subunit epsilon
MADTLKLEVVTPEHRLVREDSTEITIPGRNGYIGILPGHAPLISELAVGEIAYKLPSGQTKYLACAWGFAEVLPDKVTILAEVAERGEDIDIDRAKEAKEHAQGVLRIQTHGEEYEAARRELELAENRIHVAGKVMSHVGNVLP